VQNLNISKVIGRSEADHYKKNNKALVSKVKDHSSLKEGLSKCVDLIGGFARA